MGHYGSRSLMRSFMVSGPFLNASSRGFRGQNKGKVRDFRSSRGLSGQNPMKSSPSGGASLSASGTSPSNGGSGFTSRSSWWKMSAYLSFTALIGAFFGSSLTYMYTDFEKKKKIEKIEKLRALAKEKQLHADGVVERKTASGGGHCKLDGNSVEYVAWHKAIAGERGAVRVLTAEDLLSQEHPFLEDDHMFSAFVARGIINDMEGYYVPKKKKFSAVVALGREVAGFPRIVHGGLTAAIFDEAFGGLLFSLKKTGGVSFWGPAYTVQLEVTYKSKISADSTVLCTAKLDKVDGRKLYMTAVMSDGPDGKVFATSKALFVTPKPHKLVTDVVKYMFQRLREKV